MPAPLAVTTKWGDSIIFFMRQGNWRVFGAEVVLATVVSVAVFPLGTSAAPAGGSASCGPAKGTTLVSGRRARIYSLPGSKPPWTERVFGCLSSVSRVWQLSPIGKSSWPVRMGEPFDLRAPWVAGLVSKHGRDTLRLAIGARDLRTGTFKSCAVGSGFNPGNKPSVAGFVLKRDGSVAWIGESRVAGTGRRAPAVGACDSTGEHILDSGEGIDLHSLALHGSMLTWTDAGLTRSALLH